MKSEKEKMLGGELYDPLDPELSSDRRRARLLLKALNDTSNDPQKERTRLIKELIPTAGHSIWIETPFYCDYGHNISLGDQVFFNFNCVILDVAPVVIGSGVLFGPAVQIYAATHPLSAAKRRAGLELGLPITIEDDVWVGGGAVICPGVCIGAASVIGAGAVVTKDIPPGVVAVGNPCRIVRKVED
ncbi:MAG: sugar O-acetyltransferase [Cyanobacteria bacterium J06638_6]